MCSKWINLLCAVVVLIAAESLVLLEKCCN